MFRKKKIKVFVSYSRHDEGTVKPLASLMGVVTDDVVFMDVSELKPGDDWKASIDAAIREASVFILCWCCACERSEYVAKEISVALETPGKRLVPALFCSTPVPEALAARQWIDFRGKLIHTCNGHQETITYGPETEFVTPETLSASERATLSALTMNRLVTYGIFAVLISLGTATGTLPFWLIFGVPTLIGLSMTDLLRQYDQTVAAATATKFFLDQGKNPKP
jgi:TIR domain